MYISIKHVLLEVMFQSKIKNVSFCVCMRQHSEKYHLQYHTKCQKYWNGKFIVFIFVGLILSIFQSSAENKIKIGLIVPLTGEYKNIGNSILKSTRLAINKIDNNRIEIIPRDTKFNPETALKVSRELYEQGVRIIIGPVFNKNLIYLEELE